VITHGEARNGARCNIVDKTGKPRLGVARPFADAIIEATCGDVETLKPSSLARTINEAFARGTWDATTLGKVMKLNRTYVPSRRSGKKPQLVFWSHLAAFFLIAGAIVLRHIA